MIPIILYVSGLTFMINDQSKIYETCESQGCIRTETRGKLYNQKDQQ